MFSPVAVTMMSAGSSSPFVRRIPVGVNRSMVAVTISALPPRIAWKKSPSGHRAQTLIPRFVSGSQMGVVIIVGGQVHHRCFAGCLRV